MSEQETDTEEEFIDQDLYNKSSDFIESVIDRLSNLGGMSEEGDPAAALLDLSQFGVDYESGEVGEPMSLANSLDSKWSEFDNYSECVAKFRSSDVYLNRELNQAEENGVIDEENYEEYIEKKTLPDLLANYLKNNGELEFNGENYKQVYQNFEEYLTMDEVSYVSVAPLYNFNMDQNLLELDKDLKIKKLERDELHQVVELPPHILNASGGTHHELSEFVIEKTHSVDKFDESPEPAEEELDKVILAFRLFDSEGDITYSRVHSKSTSPFYEERSRSMTDFSASVLNKEYSLSEEDCAEFLEFWEIIKEQMDDTEEAYRIALDKFSNTFHRENRNDRLLDCVITLEALYLKGGEEGEMSYRLSQRGALLLSEDGDEADTIQDTLKSAYNARSDIVHGGRVSSVADEDEVLEILELTRESLSEFLRRSHDGPKRESILEELDKIAITPQ